MNAFINGYREIHSSLLQDSDNPAFRKATSNMQAAHAVCKQTFDLLSPSEKESLSLIVVTHFGEVSSSLEFLTALHESNIAKPILFQNSLHNSTLGFVSIQLGLKGPALTLSADIETNAAISHTTETLLMLTDHVLVCWVDIVPEYLKENYLLAFPELKPHLGWARSILLSKTELQTPDHQSNIDLKNFNFTSYIHSQSLGQ